MKPAKAWLTSSVLAISLASLLSDACYELIIPLLPALITSLGGGAFAVGAIEGIADGLASVLKLWGGALADYTKRRRAITAGAYAGGGPLHARHRVRDLGRRRAVVA